LLEATATEKGMSLLSIQPPTFWDQVSSLKIFFTLPLMVKHTWFINTFVSSKIFILVQWFEWGQELNIIRCSQQIGKPHFPMHIIFSGTNTQAYFAANSMTKKKSFITLTPVCDDIANIELVSIFKCLPKFQKTFFFFFLWSPGVSCVSSIAFCCIFLVSFMLGSKSG